MDSHNLILTLGKVVIAAAWADGRVSEEEVESVRDLLFHLPHVGQEQGVRLNEQDWQLLELYLLTPVGEAERRRRAVALRAYADQAQERERPRSIGRGRRAAPERRRTTYALDHVARRLGRPGLATPAGPGAGPHGAPASLRAP